jgi:hypothetical protein
MKEEKKQLRKAVLHVVRKDFIDQGGNDGRFKERTVKSKKAYKRAKYKKDIFKQDDL